MSAHATALIADDEPLLRDALRRQLAIVWPELEIVAEARNGREAVRLFDERHPRSARFQLAKLAKHLRLLPDANLIEVLGEVDHLHDACRTHHGTQGELFGGRPSVGRLLLDAERLVSRVSDALTLRYFSHVDDLPRATVAV